MTDIIVEVQSDQVVVVTQDNLQVLEVSSPSGGVIAGQTGAVIKALYEAEPNTNAFTDAEKIKLAGTNATTNLGYTAAAATGTVTSSNGTDAVIPAATPSLAGLLTGADKTRLDSLSPTSELQAQIDEIEALALAGL